MMKIFVVVAAAAAILGLIWPLASSSAGGSQNEATRLVQAADRTQNKAQSLSRSYNNLIPPPDSVPSPSPSEGEPQPEESGPTTVPTPTPTLTPSEHAVKDAMDFLNRAQEELEPGSTAYLQAVNRLKAAWDPRYAEAVDEFRRFKRRVEHSGDMSDDYMEIQHRLTSNISDPEVRTRLQEVDARERELIIEWMSRASNVLGQAEAIKITLDDMNIRITKLELSATFASVYEGFTEIPLALTTLNGELARFEQETERIYEVFGPKAGE